MRVGWAVPSNFHLSAQRLLLRVFLIASFTQCLISIELCWLIPISRAIRIRDISRRVQGEATVEKSKNDQRWRKRVMVHLEIIIMSVSGLLREWWKFLRALYGAVNTRPRIMDWKLSQTIVMRCSWYPVLCNIDTGFCNDKYWYLYSLDQREWMGSCTCPLIVDRSS